VAGQDESQILSPSGQIVVESGLPCQKDVSSNADCVCHELAASSAGNGNALNIPARVADHLHLAGP
jgi:hypothetical protein